MPGGDPFIAETAVDFIDLLKAAYQKAF